jgi:hypothetical protein
MKLVHYIWLDRLEVKMEVYRVYVKDFQAFTEIRLLGIPPQSDIEWGRHG